MIPLPTLDALDSVSIPVPCPVPWDAMHGNDRTRYCDRCEQNVHDVSELSRAEALALIGEAGTKPPCLRVFRRPDGRVMTADCTTRRERAWKWLDRRAPRLARLFALVFLAGCGAPECVAGGIGPPPGPLPSDTEHAVSEAGTAVAAGAVRAARP